MSLLAKTEQRPAIRAAVLAVTTTARRPRSRSAQRVTITVSSANRSSGSASETTWSSEFTTCFTFEEVADEAEGPFTVEAELLYQGIAFRWANNLSQVDAYETNRFLAYYMAYPSPAAVVTSASTTTE